MPQENTDYNMKEAWALEVILAFNLKGTPLGLFDRPCAPSPTSDQNYNMADDEEDCSGEIYDP